MKESTSSINIYFIFDLSQMSVTLRFFVYRSPAYCFSVVGAGRIYRKIAEFISATA